MRTPRIRHLRYRTLARTRYSRYFLEWLSAHATRLELTAAEVFDMLVGGSAAAVEAEPDPE